LFERFSWILDVYNTIQHFKYYIENHFTDKFVTKFKNNRDTRDELVLIGGAGLIRKYIETFKQSGIIDHKICDEKCNFLIENFYFNADVVNTVKELGGLNVSVERETLESNFEKIKQTERYIIMLYQINERKFKSSLDLIRHHIQNNYQDRMNDKMIKSYNIIIDLYRAFMENDKEEKSRIFRELSRYWFAAGIKRNGNIDSTDFTFGDLSEVKNIRNVLEKLETLFNTRIKLENYKNRLQSFKKHVNVEILSYLLGFKHYFIEERDNEPQINIEEVDNNFDRFRNEFKDLNDFFDHFPQDANGEKDYFNEELNTVVEMFDKAANDFQLHSIIKNINKSRAKSLDYLLDNLSNFTSKIWTIYYVVNGLANPDEPQDSETILHQVDFFDKKLEHIRGEIRNHIGLVKKLRKIPKNKDNEDNEDLKLDYNNIFRYISVEGIEKVLPEFWNFEVNDIVAKNTLDYDVKVLKEKLIALYKAQLKADFAQSLAVIKFGLNGGKKNYLSKTIANVKRINGYLKGEVQGDIIEMKELASKYYIDSFDHIKYKIELLDLLLDTLKQLQKLYNIDLKFTTSDIFLRNITSFKELKKQNQSSGFDLGAKIETVAAVPVELLYEEEVFSKVRLTIREFQLIFIKYRLAFFEETSGIEPFQKDFGGDSVEIKLSNVNLLIFHEIEEDIDAFKFFS
jgi:hypothetical protein